MVTQSDTYSPSPYKHHASTMDSVIKKAQILKKFGDRVRAVRMQKGITSQMTLALRAGLDRTYVGGIERGERNVALKNIEKIAGALGVRVRDLMEDL